MAQDLTGSRLGNWQLTEQLGHSLCSEVYHARHESECGDAPAAYVVKVVGPTAPKWAQHMLENERRVLSQVSHPNVVSLLDAGQERGCRYLVLPFLEGMLTPDGRTRPAPESQWSRVAWVTRQIVCGLRALHAAGWCHGDLKPVHLSVDPNLHVTLIDLGMSRRLYCSETRRLTGVATPAPRADRTLLGSPPYMAPEVFVGQPPVAPAQDVYSLGCVLYHWLTGMRPFAARRFAAWKQAHLSARPVPPIERVPNLPEPVSSLILRMLAKQPTRRPSLDEIEATMVRLEVLGFGDWLDAESQSAAA